MCSKQQKGPQLGNSKSEQQHLQLVKHLQFTCWAIKTILQPNFSSVSLQHLKSTWFMSSPLTSGCRCALSLNLINRSRSSVADINYHWQWLYTLHFSLCFGIWLKIRTITVTKNLLGVNKDKLFYSKLFKCNKMSIL